MSMDDSDIDLFLSETNALDSTLYRELPISCLGKETMTNLMESTISIPPPNESSHVKTLPFTDNQMPPWMATSSLHPPSTPIDAINDIGLGLVDPFETMDQTSTCFTNEKFPFDEQSLRALVGQRRSLHPEENPTEKSPSTNFCTRSILANPEEKSPLFYFPRRNHPMNPENQPPDFFSASQNILLNDKQQLGNSSIHCLQVNTKGKHQLPDEFLSPTRINLETQSLNLPYRPSSLNSNFRNAMHGILNHDKEAVLSFLSGQVRPGPDVNYIYRCNECSLEFPNAQAFGGHMSSHSKYKRVDNPIMTEEGNSKRNKRSSIKASSSNSSKNKAENRKRNSRRERTEKSATKKLAG
ncbi:uncharacterized protein A4U43_C05F30970 [Asparagus officinalis]|uniref:C2H2-type domain-containing protein n=1 Tax=Asparagus officinalis TaxID=4686 RepID=A0A5P1EVQ8_ASPOF|nr:uncharacterized protein A4U43_C05F30970 [Asparagus officinalis]